MACNDSSAGEPHPAQTGKKTYEKPSFRYERVFVTSTLTCGKTSPVESNCHGISNLSAS
jgi:hypothetical protein